MKRHQIRYAFLLASALAVTPVAIAQTTAPFENRAADATPGSPSIAEPLARGAGRTAIQSETNAPVSVPVNVLDDDPRYRRRDLPPTTCDNDPLTGEIPERCRRWSEIASQG